MPACRRCQRGKALDLAHRCVQAVPVLEHALALSVLLNDPARSPVVADEEVALAGCALEGGQRERARGLLADARRIQASHVELGPQYTTPLRLLEARLASAGPATHAAGAGAAR